MLYYDDAFLMSAGEFRSKLKDIERNQDEPFISCVIVSNLKLYGDKLNKIEIDNASFAYGNFEKCKMNNSHFKDVQFSSCIFEESSFNEAKFENCTFIDCSFNDCSMQKSNFINCTVQQSFAINANIQETIFEKCKFAVFIVFLKCNLMNSKFRSCKAFRFIDNEDEKEKITYVNFKDCVTDELRFIDCNFDTKSVVDDKFVAMLKKFKDKQ